MSQKIIALAAREAKGKLSTFEYDPGEIGREQVEIEVQYCGVCHSDLSMLNNEWGMSSYPLVAGHEVIGKIVAAGPDVHGLANRPGDPIGATVGLGWYSQSCMACHQCLSGNHNLCGTVESTIVGRYGGFATRVRAHWGWAVPLPEGVDASKAGPLFCGGLTVFNPIVRNGIQPTDRVGVIGIGGLGHMALQFLNKWGCEVYAFSSNPSKRSEILAMGAHHVLDSRGAGDMKVIGGRLNYIISTVNANLDWASFLQTLAPRGRLIFVGIVPEPISAQAFTLISGEKGIVGSPLGSPVTAATMLDFCGRHHIAPITEQFKMSEVNEALAHLEKGKARYRVVLKNDLN